jgi:signal transduction histidine kinase
VLRPRVIDVNRVVADLMELMTPSIGEQIACDVRLDGGLWPVCVDPVQMEQVLLRLIVNARDAMPEGGRLVVTSRNVVLEPGDSRLQGALEPGPHVHLAVSDSGPGLDADAQARAFEPFFVPRAGASQAGGGLALAMVHGVVDQSGGHTSVSSDPAVGTTFHILLRRADVQTPVLAPSPVAGRVADVRRFKVPRTPADSV